MSLDDLYREVILEHYSKPHNKGTLPGANLHVEGANPSCGDELTLHLFVDDGVVRAVRFEGHGCSISQASTSLMTDVVTGKTIAEAEALIERFRAMMRGEPPAEALGDLAALQGVRKFPVRVKCATLSWSTLQQAFDEQRGKAATRAATSEAD